MGKTHVIRDEWSSQNLHGKMVGRREREKKEKLLLEKKTVRKCRGCLTCVQQFVTIWFAMDWLNYTVGWQNLTYTKEGPSLRVLFFLSCQCTEVSFTRFFGLINLSSMQCTYQKSIQISNYYSLVNIQIWADFYALTWWEKETFNSALL